ncbi:MAG: divergent polysaccharide deacetylase family protein [Pelagimonas sp.]|uniref:divergent polysaccharide deacetylase family protein n=1 Tax=Pelagimonas sp. TaxID=2073170 RepID=UPI003D6BA5E9
MARGFLSGSIWGVVLSGAAVGTLSVATGPLKDGFKPAQNSNPAPAIAEPVAADPAPSAPAALPPATPAPATPAPQAAATSKPEPVAEAGARDEITATATPVDPAKPGRRPQSETGFEMPQAPGGALDAPEAPFSVGADTELPKQPVIGAAPQAPTAAEPTSDGAQVVVASDAPVQPLAQAEVPGAPKPEASLVISTEPAQPPVPALSNEESALVSDDPQAEPAIDAPEADIETARVTAPEAQEPAPVQPSVPEPKPVVTAQADPVQPETAQPRPRIGKPAGSLIDRDNGAASSRFSRLGAESNDETVEKADPSNTPLVQFAAKPDPAPADGQPRISVILIDDKVDTWGPEALKTLPIPVSIAIPPSHPEAAQTAADYRRLGFEVLAMADIPEGAQPSDVEVTLSGTLQAVPEAVAVLENPVGAGVQSSRAVSNQTAAYLAASGHGLVMMPKGLNTAQQLAAKAGVPSASLFRDMDRDKQDAATVRRALDQAVFRAKQEGAVIMLGRLHANTLSGLIQWGLQDKNASIAIVPVSTVLQEALEK